MADHVSNPFTGERRSKSLDREARRIWMEISCPAAQRYLPGAGVITMTSKPNGMHSERIVKAHGEDGGKSNGQTYPSP